MRNIYKPPIFWGSKTASWLRGIEVIFHDGSMGRLYIYPHRSHQNQPKNVHRWIYRSSHGSVMGMDPAPAHTRWSPTIVISFITPINDLIQRVTGVITQLITTRGPPCRLFVYLTIYYTGVISRRYCMRSSSTGLWCIGFKLFWSCAQMTWWFFLTDKFEMFQRHNRVKTSFLSKHPNLLLLGHQTRGDWFIFLGDFVRILRW